MLNQINDTLTFHQAGFLTATDTILIIVKVIWITIRGGTRPCSI